MHHSRRKSGHGAGNTSMTDVRRAVTATDPTRFKRPNTLSRRTTPVSSAQKLGRNPREREREWQESYDERESFPQFCMACEKQFLPHDDKFLYCSEACRLYDQDAGAQDDLYRRGAPGAHVSHHALYSVDYSEPRDIIPRASPSRPSSTNFSPPTSPGTMGSHYHHQQHHSSAISALRSLNVHPPSPPSPDGSQPSLWPFTKTAATSPSTSYNRSGSGFFSSTYDTGYGTAGHGYNYSTSGMDRPLPTRRPTGYSRPKSIELVTPMVGR